MPGPAKNHLQIKSSQKCALPLAKEENLFSNKYLAWKGGGEPRVTKGASGLGLFGLPGLRRSGRAQLTTGTDRLISTWSCRNPIRGLRSVGQPRHVNLFSMCAARRSQTTGAHEARPQARCSGELIKSLRQVSAARLRRLGAGRARGPWGGRGRLLRAPRAPETERARGLAEAGRAAAGLDAGTRGPGSAGHPPPEWGESSALAPWGSRGAKG